jgi:hypothetical protein
MPMALTKAKTATVSNTLHFEKGRKGAIVQSSTTGTMIKMPVVSASHQVIQVMTGSAKAAAFARVKPARAMVELIIAVGAKEMSANFAMPEGVASVLGPFDQRLISEAPEKAAGILTAATYLLELIIVAASYFGLAAANLLAPSINPAMTPLWPPTGITLALVLLRGNQIWPAILVGSFAPYLIAGRSILEAGSIGIGTLHAKSGSSKFAVSRCCFH